MKELEAPESLFPCVSSSKKKAEPIPFRPARRAEFLTMSFLRRIYTPICLGTHQSVAFRALLQSRIRGTTN